MVEILRVDSRHEWKIARFLSLVHTCRKSRGFTSSDICERVPNKHKYRTNIRFLLQRYVYRVSQKKVSVFDLK